MATTPTPDPATEALRAIRARLARVGDQCRTDSYVDRLLADLTALADRGLDDAA